MIDDDASVTEPSDDYLNRAPRAWRDRSARVVTSEARVVEHRDVMDDAVCLLRILGHTARHLPDEAAPDAFAEIDAASPENRDAVIAAWRATARAYANPELLSSLTQDSWEDVGRVALPAAFAHTGGDAPKVHETILEADD